MSSKTGFANFLALGASAIFTLGASGAALAADPVAKMLPLSDIEFDITAYYLIGSYTGESAFGSLTPVTTPGFNGSNIVSENFTRPVGGGVSVGATKWTDPDHFLRAVYTGFFSSGDSSLGNPNVASGSVYMGLHDRSLANLVLDSSFDDGFADFASENISVAQNFVDLIKGERSGTIGPLSGHWYSGVRIAHTSVDRSIIGSVASGATASIEMESRMWGTGPTIGGGVDILLSPRTVMSLTASATALVGQFDVSRSDVYVNGATNGIRQMSANVTDVVPVFDATASLTRRMGRFNLSVGYTASAWIGGARSFQQIGGDDVDGTTNAYMIGRDNIITHAVHARISTGLGPFAGKGDASASLFDGAGPVKYDFTGYYLLSSLSAAPAYGTMAQPTGPGINTSTSNISTLEQPVSQGGGVRVSMQRGLASDWYAGLAYTGFFASEATSIGTVGVTTDTVYVGLHDRSLANLILNSNFDDGFADYAAEDLSISQNFIDLTLGQTAGNHGPLSTFWQTGLRVGHVNVDRNVTYAALEGVDVITANTKFNSTMWGAGPTIGGGIDVLLTPHTTFSASASASALYAYFDVSRTDVQDGATNNGMRAISSSLADFVPVFDASVALTHDWGRFRASIGYTASAWLGGYRSYQIAGHDDVDGGTTSYVMTSDDIITHAFFIRGGMGLGVAEKQAESGQSLFGQGGAVSWDLTGYYLFGNIDGEPAFGTATPITGPTASSSIVAEDTPSFSGGGVQLAMRRNASDDWYAGLSYTGFFVSSADTIGNPAVETNSVYATLIDRSLADDTIDGFADDGLVDYASDRTTISQHMLDLTIGRMAATGPGFNGHWHAGVRVGAANVDRDVIYVDATGPATANLAFSSQMWGAGPTVGGGFDYNLTPGLKFVSSASVSALYSFFDISRLDVYSTGASTGIRLFNSDMTAFVPVFDSSIALKKTFGRLEASIGYTTSIWLGGARSLLAAGNDDVDGTSSPYIVRKDDIITHGVFARVSLGLGGDPVMAKY
ncbi:MAG: hypothetical protein H6883_06475 [Rhodobiaceae bacterium]|nr:hypothetical protein [Rhodobiaceae bacterium]MCC0055763.1 hypothetical protein [Rhodobiaceae bacterium]